MEPFIGQIMMVSYSFAPRGWAFCAGQLLTIASYQSLFSLLGTEYGGDGRTTFGLPDLRGRCAVGMRQGLGLTSRRQVDRIGQETVILTQNEMPGHSHQFLGNNGDAPTNDPTNSTLVKENVVIERGSAAIPVNGYNTGAANAGRGASIGNTGANMPHNNMQPSLEMNYVIALQGIFPSRN